MSLVKGWGLTSLVILVLVALTTALVARWTGSHSPEQAGPGYTADAFTSLASTERTIQTLQSRLKSNDGNVAAYSMLGNAYLQKVREVGDPSYYGRAEEAFRRALSLDPKDSQAMAGMGSLALSRHQFQEALDWGERARQSSPQSAHNYGILGDAYVELGRYSEAWPAFQQMVDLRPNLSSYSRVSYARELTGDIPGAVEAMKQALSAGGPNSENTNWTRVQLGHLYFNSGDLPGAETEYREALRLYPGYVHAQAGQARVMAARGQYAEAIALYQQVVDRIPLPEYVIALGDLYTVAGQSQEAAKMYALVGVQQRLYQANGVNTDLELALFDADHNQNLVEALARSRQEYQRRPSIGAADVLAWTLYKNGLYQEASNYSAQALRLGTKDALMLFHAGMVHYRLGNSEEARALLEQAFTINPHFSVLYRDEALRTLEGLRSGFALAQAAGQ